MKEYSPKPPDPLPPGHMPAGFRAHLQGVSLHDLVMLQHLAHASGVFVVLSGERSGTLHFAQGTLFHAEIDDGGPGLAGNRAAVEILSWPDGEFLTSTQRAAERASVSLSIEELLGAPGAGADAIRSTETGIRRRSSRGVTEAVSARSVLPRAASPGIALAAVATPGTALTTPRLMPRAEVRGEVQVLVSPRGELIDGRGSGAESLAARVAYVARLAELIGQAMGSGEAHGVRVRGPHGELSLQRHPDGHIAGSFGAVDTVETAPVTAGPPPLPASSQLTLPAGAPGAVPQTRRPRLPSS